MINLKNTSSKIQVITGSALSTRVHAAFVDMTLSSGAIAPDATNSNITTATTTDVVASPTSGVVRNVRTLIVHNNDSSNNLITIQHTDGTTVVELWEGILPAGWKVILDETGYVTVYNSNGLPIAPPANSSLINFSTAAQGAGFASDTYLTGSSILIPIQRPKVGTVYRCRFSVSKTAAGTATPIITLRYGTAATTADASVGAHTFSAGTAATDVGLFELFALFRTVGSGTAAVIQSHCSLISQPTTGFSSLLKGTQATSGGFDSTTANTYLGVSVNGGTSASWTVQQVWSELFNI